WAEARPASFCGHEHQRGRAWPWSSASQARLHGASFLDAPVSGGDVGARQGSLSIMVGGDQEAFQSLQGLFELMGHIIVHHGPAGCGQHAKMSNQIVVAGSMIGVCEALLYAEEAGLDWPKLLSSISKGAAGCWALDRLAPRILQGDFEPGFYIHHFVKDMSIALEEAAHMGLELHGLGVVKRIYERCVAMGLGNKGTQALFLGLKQQTTHP
ncbi:MAG: NAD(P)-dependent oxidoreductase, partial [Cytophagales bacterium]|nr:NAD(P)-dependent oxidoreductase [Cytophagales bacterium]